ncbi:MAG: T9SS type A sorting domain-containing protein [Cytophagales bacterium]|nr:T9SS type A sorting domain-containing protein [Cytophagales bacterium]
MKTTSIFGNLFFVLGLSLFSSPLFATGIRADWEDQTPTAPSAPATPTFPEVGFYSVKTSKFTIPVGVQLHWVVVRENTASNAVTAESIGKASQTRGTLGTRTKLQIFGTRSRYIIHHSSSPIQRAISIPYLFPGQKYVLYLVHLKEGTPVGNGPVGPPQYSDVTSVPFQTKATKALVQKPAKPRVGLTDIRKTSFSLRLYPMPQGQRLYVISSPNKIPLAELKRENGFLRSESTIRVRYFRSIYKNQIVHFHSIKGAGIQHVYAIAVNSAGHSIYDIEVKLGEQLPNRGIPEEPQLDLSLRDHQGFTIKGDLQLRVRGVPKYETYHILVLSAADGLPHRGHGVVLDDAGIEGYQYHQVFQAGERIYAKLTGLSPSTVYHVYARSYKGDLKSETDYIRITTDPAPDPTTPEKPAFVESPIQGGVQFSQNGPVPEGEEYHVFLLEDVVPRAQRDAVLDARGSSDLPNGSVRVLREGEPRHVRFSFTNRIPTAHSFYARSYKNGLSSPIQNILIGHGYYRSLVDEPEDDTVSEPHFVLRTKTTTTVVLLQDGVSDVDTYQILVVSRNIVDKENAVLDDASITNYVKHLSLNPPNGARQLRVTISGLTAGSTYYVYARAYKNGDASSTQKLVLSTREENNSRVAKPKFRLRGRKLKSFSIYQIGRVPDGETYQVLVLTRVLPRGEEANISLDDAVPHGKSYQYHTSLSAGADREITIPRLKPGRIYHVYARSYKKGETTPSTIQYLSVQTGSFETPEKPAFSLKEGTKAENAFTIEQLGEVPEGETYRVLLTDQDLGDGRSLVVDASLPRVSDSSFSLRLSLSEGDLRRVAFTGLRANTIYYIYITANNPSGRSTQKLEVSTQRGSDPLPPAPPELSEVPLAKKKTGQIVSEPGIGFAYVYPNPSRGIVHLSGCLPGVRVWIYSLTGNLVAEQELSYSGSLDLSRLRAGTYVVRTLQHSYRVILSE